MFKKSTQGNRSQKLSPSVSASLSQETDHPLCSTPSLTVMRSGPAIAIFLTMLDGTGALKRGFEPQSYLKFSRLLRELAHTEDRYILALDEVLTDMPQQEAVTIMLELLDDCCYSNKHV
jgi:hypothetical protein